MLNERVLKRDRSPVWTTQERSKAPQLEAHVTIPAHPPNDTVPDSAAENYWLRSQPWCVIQRFRTRTQAEDSLKAVRKLMPTTTHRIVFDLLDPN